MNNWLIKSADFMKVQQDVVTNPPTFQLIDAYVSAAKDLGATHISICVPYDHPTIDVNAQTKIWVGIARKYGLSVWFRKSWCSDEGWYGVAKDTTNDRINDTKNWIAAHADFFQDGDIFTPKPEPQNCGVIGINGNGTRFSSVARFNQWLRDMMTMGSNEFASLNKKVKVGYWGFDGFVVCGYGNPDWQGKSFLEPATVVACGNVLAVDHYPELVGKPMTDFLTIFKKVWPGVKYVQGEWGAVGSTDTVTQIATTMGTLDSDPLVVGFNYWTMVGGGSEKLLNADGTKIQRIFDSVKMFFTAPTVTPTPPAPVTPPTVDDDPFIKVGDEVPHSSYYPLIVNGTLLGYVKLYKKIP